MPLAYYANLSRKDKALYRRSDELRTLPLPDAERLRGLATAVEAGLLANDVRATQKASHRLVAAVCEQLGAPPVTVRVLARRPSDDESELHGLYESEEGKRAVIRAWMRTAVHERPVAYRSFLRTLLHEVCHHVDFTVLAFEESFHTEGFFAREAHLARQILGPPPARASRPRDDDGAPPGAPGAARDAPRAAPGRRPPPLPAPRAAPAQAARRGRKTTAHGGAEQLGLFGGRPRPS